MYKLHCARYISAEAQNSVLTENGPLFVKELSQEGTFYGFKYKALLTRIQTVAHGHKKENIGVAQVARDEQKKSSIFHVVHLFLATLECSNQIHENQYSLGIRPTFSQFCLLVNGVMFESI